MRLVAALLLLWPLAACRAAAPSEPRSEHARATMPNELLPDDLDFVVRIDAARVRQNPGLIGLLRDLAKTKQSELLESIKAAFGDASAVWVGTRWMSDGFHGDGVVAIERPPAGDADVARPAMRSTLRRVAVVLPDVEAFERSASARGEAVLEVVMRRGVVLATAAEADSVLRVMRSGPDQGRLEPPARGLVSFAERDAARIDGGTHRLRGVARGGRGDRRRSLACLCVGERSGARRRARQRDRQAPRRGGRHARKGG